MSKEEPIRLNPECISCLVKKQIEYCPDSTKRSRKTEYMQKILRVIADAPQQTSAPEIVDEIYRIQKQMFSEKRDYSQIKRHFNKLMLELEPTLQSEISTSAEPLKSAVQYAMTGNYIDFAAMDSVDENKLRELLGKAKDKPVDDEEFSALKADISSSGSLVYLTDNCGEIVLDKLLIKTIKKLNPEISTTVIVRGERVVNDATMEDAEQTGITDTAAVIGSGSSVAGTCLNKISSEAKKRLESADVIISKGQGNFETLQQCGLNVYYIFMCKCKMFADRFNVPLYHGILVNDKSIMHTDE